MQQRRDELAQAAKETQRAVALMERAGIALQAGDRDRAGQLLNTAHQYANAAAHRLERLAREAELVVAEVGC